MKTTSIKGVLSFCVAVTVTVAMAYSAVTVIQKNNAAAEKAVKESQAIGSEVSTDSLKDGEYEGTATGYGGPLTVRITIKGGKLTDIKVVSHTETPEYFSRASAVIGKILNSGNVNVDSVSGATISSNAIKKAVADALQKAGSKQQAKMSTVKKDARNTKGRRGNVAGSFAIANANLNDGVYTGSGQGFNGPIRVRVTVSGGNITNVEILSHSDDAPYFNRAKAVISRLLGKPGKSVDTVSGATYSSRGIIDAVRNALANAGKTNVTNTNSNTNKPNNNNNNTPGMDNKPPLVNPETGEPSYVDAALRKHYPGDKLKDGEYTGIGIGYLNPGGIKTYVTVKNGEISSLRVGVGDEYRDDIDPFRNKAEKVLPFLQGKEGRWNIAKMGLYREYFEAIRKSRDPRAKVKELFGDKYVGMLTGLSRNSESNLTLMSRTVKAYMGDRYEGKKMFDSVTGATVSASGISAATKEATNKSANDFKMNSDVKEISIIEPKVKTIEVNKGDSVDFSELKIKVTKKDGSVNEVEWKDFAANGLSISDEDGNAIENGSDLKAYGDKRVIKAKVVHKESLSYDNFRILVGRYSKDYIVGLEYSKDGSKWYKVSDVKRDYADDRKIDNQQIVDAPISFEFENVKIRLVSKEGHRYEYTADEKPVNRKVKYTVVKDENPNAPHTIFVTFQLSGTEADKELVGDDGGDNGGSIEEPNLPEVEVKSNVIETELDNPGRPKWTERMPIKPATVKSLDKDAEMQTTIEGLPKGLSFDGTTITGTPVVEDDNWDGDGGMFKTVNMKFKAKKNGVMLVRKYKYWIYRDKDRDGIADDDEDGGTAFTPQRHNSKPLVVDGKEPTLDDYKALFSNIPADGSVKVSIKQKPDLSKKGTAKAVLEFSVDGVKKNGRAIVIIDVKNPVEESEPNLPEVEVKSNVIETELDNPGRPKWTERMPIKPATVKSLDKDAEMQTTIEGLPKGLSFDGTTITGTPVVEDDNWDGDGGMFKTVNMKFKAKKNGVMLVRKYKYWIYRDKDRDGIADDDEDGGTAFTPQRHNSKPLVVDGKEPTLDDYKALFSNIPADGSVKVSIKQKPDLSKKGTAKAVLEFSVDGVKKNGRAIVIIDVKNPVEESEPNLPEVEVKSNVIETELDNPGRPKWTERMPIKPATVKSLDKDAEMQTTIEGLPKGLSFDGTTITGTPVVEDDNWDGDGGMFKTVNMKFKAKKNGVMLVRKYKYWIYRDKDRDGIADDDEDGGTAFTPQRHNSKPLVVDGKEPTLDDYKALFSNIPADGSVKVSIKQKPDLSKKGTAKAVLEFSVDGVKKNGRAIVIIDVKNPVEESEPNLPEVEVKSNVIETELDNPGRPKWTERMPIKPATVKSLDKDAEMQTTIEGLPKGLSFDGTTITGTPVVEDDNWDGDGGMFKTVNMKFKAKKNGVMLVRKYKYWIYRDKDRDGIADDDEDGGTAFTPQRHNSKPLVVDGKEPTLDDYKALFSNIPADGSVKVSIKQKPDLSKKGTAKAVLEFSVDGVKKNGRAIVIIDVKNPVEESEPNLPEVEVKSNVIETELDNPGRPKWTERMPIKPATVKSLDKDAEMQTTIEGLPKGLSFDGTTITGTPVVEDDNWDGDGGMFKTVNMKFKAKKNGVMLVRKYKYWIYRDKDRDGIADDDEDGGTAFTPQRHNSKPLVVDGKEPTLDDYKALFSNIPADGSVKVSIKQKPDLSKKGTAKAVLEFSVDGVKKNGRATVIIDVKNPVEESANAAVSSSTSSTRSATIVATASSNSNTNSNSSSNSNSESVENPENGKSNNKEDVNKPAEKAEAATDETERTVQ